jgi:hypothetical protein
MLSIEELNKTFERIEAVESARVSIVASDAKAGQIIRALEYGSIAGHPPWPSPGPKTTLAVDPESGLRVVVSLQAPQGLIRIRAQRLLEFLRDSLPRSVNWLDAEAVATHLQRKLRNSASKAVEELRAALPTRLAQSLKDGFDSHS